MTLLFDDKRDLVGSNVGMRVCDEVAEATADGSGGRISFHADPGLETKDREIQTIKRYLANKAEALDATKVLAIARQAVAANDNWVDRAQFETPERQPDGSWQVMVWRLPKVPGGHRLITIDANGKVAAYRRGA